MFVFSSLGPHFNHLQTVHVYIIPSVPTVIMSGNYFWGTMSPTPTQVLTGAKMAAEPSSLLDTSKYNSVWTWIESIQVIKMKLYWLLQWQTHRAAVSSDKAQILPLFR